VSTRSEQASEAIRESWDLWLSEHPASVGDMITDAVKAAVAEWLDSHADELLNQIAAEAARRMPSPAGSPTRRASGA
jgi:hypothetical protein